MILSVILVLSIVRRFSPVLEMKTDWAPWLVCLKGLLPLDGTLFLYPLNSWPGFQTRLVGDWSTLWWHLISILISLCLCSGPLLDPSLLTPPGFHLYPSSSCPHCLFICWLVCTDGCWPINHTVPCLVSSLSRLKNVAPISTRSDVLHVSLLDSEYLISNMIFSPLACVSWVVESWEFMEILMKRLTSTST